MIHSTRKWMRAALVVCCMAGMPAAAQVTQETPIDSLDDETIAKSRAAHGKNSAREEGQFDAMDYVLDSRWRAYGEDFTNRWDDHLFVQFGGGLEQMASPSSNYQFAPLTSAHFALGKQLDRLNTLRLHLRASWGNQEYKAKVYTAFGARLEHLFSLTSYVRGYNPARLIDISTLVGVGVQQAKLVEEKGLAFEAHAGLQLKFFTGPQGYVALEPYVGMANKKYDLDEKQGWRKSDMFYGAQLSYIYYIHNNLSPQSRARFIKNKSKENRYADSTLQSWQQPWFVQLAMGPAFLSGQQLGLSETMGHTVSFSVGRWLSPIIGLRFTGTQTVTTWRKELVPERAVPYHPAYERTLHNTYSGVRAEALFNPFGLKNNYLWNERWGAFLAVGGEMGWITKFQDTKLSCRSESYTAALHGWVNLGDGLQAFVEPRFNHYVYRVPYTNVAWNKSYSDNGFSLSVGLTMRTTASDFRNYTPTEADLQAERHCIVAGAGVGMSMKQTKMNYTGKGGMHYTGSAFIEYHLNHLHGVRASVEYASLSHAGMGEFEDWNMDYPEQNYLKETRTGLWDYSYNVGFVSLDYQLNLTNLFSGVNPKRRFALSMFVGPSLQMVISEQEQLSAKELVRSNHRVVRNSDMKGSKMGIGLNAGMKLEYFVTPQLGVHLTPNFYLLGSGVAKGIDLLDVRYLQSVSIGAQWKLKMGK